MSRTMMTLLVGGLLLSACGESNPSSPSSSAILQACHVNNTGTLMLQNRSATGATYDVTAEGTRVTITPQQDAVVAVTAGVVVDVVFKFTNTALASCPATTQVVPQCQIMPVACGS
jgi:hypothetical protein